MQFNEKPLNPFAEATHANLKHHLHRSESDRCGKVLKICPPRARHELPGHNTAPLGLRRAIYPVGAWGPGTMGEWWGAGGPPHTPRLN